MGGAWQNQQKDMCTWRRLRSAFVDAQSDQESLLCPQLVAKGPRFLLACSEDSDRTWRMPRLIWVFAGTHVMFCLFCHAVAQINWLVWLCVQKYVVLQWNLIQMYILHLWAKFLYIIITFWFHCYNYPWGLQQLGGRRCRVSQSTWAPHEFRL